MMNEQSHANDPTVRILLVGEREVGKTSMIYSLVFEEFDEEVPAKFEEITIPAEVTPVNIPTVIVDYSAQEQSEKELYEELRRASVICIVYAIDNEMTIDKISTYWLPLIHQNLGENHNVPVILVGNKSDLVEYSSIDTVLPLMNQYKEIEICVECSAKNLDNLSEIFYYAQKTVLYPVTPIYYPEERDLSDNCKIALKRIFTICDLDNDGVLNDLELNNFQTYCFDSYLLSQTLDDVKYILKSIIPDGVSENGITLSGFMFLLTFFIQRGRHELIWIVLRKFGYNNSVTLDDHYLYPSLTLPTECFVELSPKGYQFFTNLFHKYDKDNDGALSPGEIAAMFSICDEPPKWLQCDFTKIVHTNERGWITLQGFLSIWTLTGFIDLKQTLKYLSLFGYMFVSGEKSQISALHIIKDRRMDTYEKQTARNVFLCNLVGPKGAGKSCFMSRFINKQQKFANLSQRSVKKSDNLYNDYVINTITVYGQNKYLIIREIDVVNVNTLVKAPELFCDVCCMMFDQSDSSSFQVIAKTYMKNFHNTKLPVLLVASKKDLAQVKQNYPQQPEEFCLTNKLTPLHKFSAVNEIDTSESSMATAHGTLAVYEKLVTMAAYPNLNKLVHLLLVKPANSWIARNMGIIHRCLPQDRAMLQVAGIGFATLALIGVFIVRYLRSNIQHHPH
ncbi:Mitochondrial Rho GTPase 2 [Dermatophagoides farinae]|uniref:Mitochondrial Rho GTPase n=2 Tax=Dermatophagoides farinae TaxID=6954 RepID=A0A922KY30_DERFA|nr:Mitochondrial Rho GTPase 2 [Dermatophagoides farinae]